MPSGAEPIYGTVMHSADSDDRSVPARPLPTVNIAECQVSRVDPAFGDLADRRCDTSAIVGDVLPERCRTHQD